jgi:hypothetical protein
MSWSSFFITIFVIYFIYYAVNIAMDMMNVGKRTDKEVLETLSFSDDYKPHRVGFEEVQKVEKTEPVKEVELKIERKEGKDKEGSIGISGGVQVKELFNLAKSEAILKSRSIAFS